MIFELERISETDREEEAGLKARFNEGLPRFFGGLCNSLARTFELYPSIKLTKLQRLADWTRWGAAAAEALGFGQEVFLEAFERNVRGQNEEIMNSEPVCLALKHYFGDRTAPFEGTPSDFYHKLCDCAEALGVEGDKGWPKSAGTFSRRLNELRHNLGEAGFVVERRSKGWGRHKSRVLRVSVQEEKSSLSSVRPEANDNNTLHRDDTGTTLAPKNPCRPGGVPSNLPESQEGDDTDDRDDISAHSGGPAPKAEPFLPQCDHCHQADDRGCYGTGEFVPFGTKRYSCPLGHGASAHV